MVRRQLNIEDRGRAIAWLQVAIRKEMLLWDLVSVRVSLADFGNGSKQRILFEIVHVREDPEALQTEGTATSPIWLYVNVQALHADYVTICGLQLECLIKPYAIVWEPITYAAVARLFDHHSYHVTEWPDVIGARFICGGIVFSGVEWCSLMNPGLVSSSTTVGFVSTDVLGSASLTLTLYNVTGSVVAASWCGAASLSTTGHPSMWWMAIWDYPAVGFTRPSADWRRGSSTGWQCQTPLRQGGDWLSQTRYRQDGLASIFDWLGPNRTRLGRIRQESSK